MENSLVHNNSGKSVYFVKTRIQIMWEGSKNAFYDVSQKIVIDVSDIFFKNCVSLGNEIENETWMNE